MKQGIHPDYAETRVYCTCGNTFTTRSTSKKRTLSANVCSECHPFCTGRQRILGTDGRVTRFERMYAENRKKWVHGACEIV